MANAAMLIQIRERSFLDLLDLTVIVIRQRFRPIALSAVLGILPFALFNAYVIRLPEFSWSLLPILFLLEIPWATAPLTVVLGLLMFGETVTPQKVAKRLLGAIPALFFFQFVLRLILLISVILILLLPMVLIFLNEIILLERGRFFSIFRRSTRLTMEMQGDYFVRTIAVFLFGALFVGSFWFGTNAILSAFTSDELHWEPPRLQDVFDIRLQLAVWIALVFFTITRFLSYIDRRIRLEGWEVKLRILNVARAMEREGRR